MKLKVLVAAIAMTAAAPLAMAEGSGFYGAVDFGKTTADGFCDGWAGFSCKDNDTSVRFTLGNQLNANFGVEGSYGPAIEGTMSGFGETLVGENTEWQFAAVGTAPIGNSLSVFGKVGMAFWDIQESGSGCDFIQCQSISGNDFLMGFGVKYDISPTMAIRGQYETHKIGDTRRVDLNTLSTGLIFKF